jgi:hypothetical protein
MDDRQVNKKIDQLFADSNKGYEDVDEVFVDNKSEVIDISPEERAEVERAVRAMFSNREKKEALKPRARWTWKFYGLYLASFLVKVAEMLLIALSLYVLIPTSINIDVSIIQALSMAALLTILRKWAK